MKKFFFISLFIFVGFSYIYSQKATLSGTVRDFETNETLVGVNIIIDETSGVATDIDGTYSIELEPGRYVVEYKFIGYISRRRVERLDSGEHLVVDIRLEPKSELLDEVVVSAGKFEQDISEVTVSMDIIRASMIENTSTTNIKTALEQAPSITMMDDQASIRGGSGYSFGAGSRVLMLVDDLPMLAGSSGTAYWDFAPVENIDQVEIIKGASSALYGSSALNGVINVRTKYPRTTPETKLIMSSGFYDAPPRKKTQWWEGNNPMFTSVQFSHARMIDNFDLVIGGNILGDEGYRETESRQHGRINFNTRWRNKKIEGLSYGVNFNYMKWQGGRFVLWKDGDEGIFQVSEAYENSRIDNTRLSVDPYITYFSSVGNRHSLKTRFYKTDNRNANNQRNDDEFYYVEYQYQRYMEGNLSWTSGVSANYIESFSEIYGNENHFGSSIAGYTQLDKKINRFTASVGARWEAYRLNQDQSEGRPVFRTGLNYKLFEHTNLRASYGQGFRYPTITEKYIHTSAGQINVFPNDTLSPERGWSAELGLRQGFQVSNWRGFVDIAGFWTEYYDMIEFGFGYHFPEHLQDQTFYHPDTVFKYIGFKSHNVSNAQITGIDVSVGGYGSIYGVPVSVFAGYTYTNPIDLDIDAETLDNTSARSNMLKYRHKHSAKADAEATIRNINFGFSLNYFSHIENIDAVFEDTLRFPNGAPIILYGEPSMILPGLKEYRDKNNSGHVVFDFRLGVDMNENSRISVIVKNIFNEEYMIRPADVRPPRSFTIQYLMQF